jgi:hypothetical protein
LPSLLGAVGKGMVSLEIIGSHIVRRLSHSAGVPKGPRSLRPEARFGLKMPVRLVFDRLLDESAWPGKRTASRN